MGTLLTTHHQSAQFKRIYRLFNEFCPVDCKQGSRNHILFDQLTNQDTYSYGFPRSGRHL